MKNWLGQEILPGSVVYRGARQGNSSSFKVGIVDRVDDSNKSVRVEWKIAPGPGLYRNLNGQWEQFEGAKIHKVSGKGSPGYNTLVVLPDEIGLKIEDVLKSIDLWENDAMSSEDLTAVLDSVGFN